MIVGTDDHFTLNLHVLHNGLDGGAGRFFKIVYRHFVIIIHRFLGHRNDRQTLLSTTVLYRPRQNWRSFVFLVKEKKKAENALSLVPVVVATRRNAACENETD